MTQTGRPPRSATRASRRLQPGVKREQILEVATDYFGRLGYEDTKWADVAAAVGIGSTALYHYFESKQHCLYEIMAEAVADHRERFRRITTEHADWLEALVAVLADGFDLTDAEVVRQRLLVSEIGRLGAVRSLPREEAARSRARAVVRDLEFAWGTFLARGMQQGLIPDDDPRVLTRAVLGLYTSIWHWYRLAGELSLDDIGRFYVGKQLAVLGCDPALATARFPAAA